MTDPIADMLTRIRNGYLAGHKTVKVPHSSLKERIVALLGNSGYVGKSQVKSDGVKKTINLELVYLDGKPVVNNIEKVSKPGRRVYARASEVTTPLSGYGMVVVSTSSGLMSGDEARKKNLGGEVICKVW